MQHGINVVRVPVNLEELKIIVVVFRIPIEIQLFWHLAHVYIV